MVFNPTTRQSLPGRVTACGFILFILFGNLWLALALTGSQAPEWLALGFAAGIVLALGGGLGLGALQAQRLLRPPGPAEPPSDGDA